MGVALGPRDPASRARAPAMRALYGKPLSSGLSAIRVAGGQRARPVSQNAAAIPRRRRKLPDRISNLQAAREQPRPLQPEGDSPDLVRGVDSATAMCPFGVGLTHSVRTRPPLIRGSRRILARPLGLDKSWVGTFEGRSPSLNRIPPTAGDSNSRLEHSPRLSHHDFTAACAFADISGSSSSRRTHRSGLGAGRACHRSCFVGTAPPTLTHYLPHHPLRSRGRV